MAFCHRCDRSFPHLKAFSQHKQDSLRHNVCNDCHLDFNSPVGLKEHWVQSPQHSYCQHCNLHFDHHPKLIQHYRDSHAVCEPCNKIFKNDSGLHEHRRQSERHQYCSDCRRVFQSANNLTEHRNSSVHRPKDVPCVGCNQTFISGPALVRHLESGGCRSGIDRYAVHRAVRDYDTTHIITNPARMITGLEGQLDTVTRYIATEAAWNGRSYECYFCHKKFHSLLALNQHLSSPAHDEKIYMCPLTSCCIRFTTLSGLWSHVDSEKCGVSKFKGVRNALNGIVGRVGLIGM